MDDRVSLRRMGVEQSTYTIEDLPRVGVPEPGALPLGVARYRADDDGAAEAWLDSEGKGYIRTAASPLRAVRVDDAAVWEQISDSLGMKDADSFELEVKASADASTVAPADEEEQNGIMIAFVVPEGDAADLVLDHPTALPATQLHVTLASLGTTDEVDDEGAFYADVLEALRDVCAEYEPVTASISGIGRFTISGDADAFYYSVDAPELPELRQAIVEGLEENGLDVSREHGFTPHITVAYLKEGEDNPLRRAEPRVLAFDSLVFFYGDQRVTIRLGGQDPDEQDDAQFSIEAGQPGYVDSTAPSAMPDGKAKPNPFAKNGKGKIGKRGGPPIASGAWVSWGNQRGRVDLVVTNGKVPGVEEDITGTTDKPAARVVVYSQNGSKWSATGKKVGVSASSLKRSFPLTSGKAGKKGLDETFDAEAGLVAVLTDYYEGIGTKESPVDPTAVMTVYGRGLDSWPGEGAPAPREQWALGRTKAFLVVAAGGVVPGYEADHDLLPDAHPLAVKAAPVLTVEAEPEVDQGSEPPAAPVEEKVALTVVEGERIDNETVRSTIAELLRFARPSA